MSSIGILIGFYGYLFPGNINLMVVQLYTTKRYRLLCGIFLLFVLFEIMYCGGSLYFLSSLQANAKWYAIIEWISFLLILIMGVWMVFENKKDEKASQQNTIYRGVFSIIVHPQQIPFWIVVGVLLNGVIQFDMNLATLLPFVLFNVIGSFLMMICYMLLGNKLIGYFKLNLAQINKVMGVFYVLLALYHLIKLVYKS
jgi:putative Ca2+/H+ antiporter (TMEM165/GDT1 family)